jgi:4-amino-4-deoxy-L-arabinose transferase-like glycosyltransferase
MPRWLAPNTDIFPTLKLRDILILLVLCVLVFWAGLGRIGLIDPDEPFYAVTAREMVESNDWLTPKIFGEPQFEKPIFYYWCVAASFKVFRISEWAGRVPSALPATLLVFLTYWFVTRVFNRRAGLLAGIVLGSGLEYAIMSRLMLTDISLALFIGGALFFYWLAVDDEKNRARWLILHFVFGGLAMLTKGPLGLIVSLLAAGAFSFVTKRPHPYRGRAAWIGIALYLAIGLPWYVIMTVKHGWGFLHHFIVHENIGRFFRAEHSAHRHFYYYFGILVGGSLPWIPALVMACSRAARGIRHDPRLVFLWSWLLTSFVFLTCAQSKLPSYFFFVFVPVAVLIGVVLDDLLQKGFRNTKERVVVLALAVLQIGLGCAAPFVKQSQPFQGPALVFAGLLAVGLVVLWFGRFAVWIGINATATAALIIGALVITRDKVDEFSSGREVAKKMVKLRQGNEPMLAGNVLVRGVHFYTRLPMVVIGTREKAFNWTQHDIPVIAGVDGVGKAIGLRAFLKQHGSAICTVRRRDWTLYWEKFRFEDDATPIEWSGDNVIVRFVDKSAK